MNLQALQSEFSIPGVLAFDEPFPGMIRARVNSPACSAELYLHGAHLTAWQPAGEQPVLFLSERSAFARDKAIRGGIPVVAPWFGGAKDSPVSTNGVPEGAGSHGWARTTEWELRFAAMLGDEVRLSLALPVDEALNEKMGFPGLRLGYDIALGTTLKLQLTVANAGTGTLRCEQALHSYFAVGDATQVEIIGLEATEFLDKTEGFKRKRQEEAVLKLTGETDRPYLNTDATVVLKDPALGRRVIIAKQGSQTTVVWNPFPELAATLKDLAPGDWQRYTCIETANVAQNALQLAPGAAHTMAATVSVEKLSQ